jgi:hypothetical protein
MSLLPTSAIPAQMLHVFDSTNQGDICLVLKLLIQKVNDLEDETRRLKEQLAAVTAVAKDDSDQEFLDVVSSYLDDDTICEESAPYRQFERAGLPRVNRRLLLRDSSSEQHSRHQAEPMNPKL